MCPALVNVYGSRKSLTAVSLSDTSLASITRSQLAYIYLTFTAGLGLRSHIKFIFVIRLAAEVRLQ